MADDLLMSFMSITDENNVETAQHYLEAAGFDLETAVELFFSNQPASKSNSSATTTTSNKPTIPSDYEDIRSPIPQQASRLYDSFQGNDYSYDNSQSYSVPSFVTSNQYNNRANQQFQSSRLTKHGDEFSEMFKKPDIVFKGSFDAAKQEAETSGRWLIVEIQKDDIFDCHRMNRDTWNHEVVKTIVDTFFVLWQADDGTNQAELFKTRYRIRSYPFVCIIDPRTGENMKTWEGKYIDASTMVDSLQNFADSHSLMDHLPSPSPNTLHTPNPFDNIPVQHLPSTTATTTTSHHTDMSTGDETEEEMIRAAIEASLQESNAMQDDDVQILDSFPIAQPTTATNTISTPVVQEPPKPQETPDKQVNVSDFVVEQGDTTRIQVKLPDGKKEVIKILKSAPLAAVYAVCRQKLGDSVPSFTITYFDKTQKTLENTLEKTLGGEGILGAALSVVPE
ncbi:UBX domain-containing protein [Naegleria gruberi]|uniref:UBX domain-containing protein n=1 Tax=Naegleria gruberi TaxID=5762 RepID=D2VD49_NAEGR|nr:UBX domain-containing protein [Naegleria gruberi]EFC45172.1 UBX domain-containing protein [Naegleria gruberi]|eukprot:XP_002677916.1 UBX domain-containing protein [Naegleria gruberi strain NEG-M]